MGGLQLKYSLFPKLRLLFYLLPFLFLVACSSKLNTSKGLIENRSTDEIIKELGANELNFETFSTKASTTANIDGKTKEFKTYIKIRKDSLIWLSIAPALGIELFKAQITKDSIQYIDKLNKQFFTGGFDYVNTLFNAELTYKDLENLIIGNAVGFDAEDKYKSKTEEEFYVLTSKTTRKHRKAIDLTDNYSEGKDSLEVIVNDRKLRKAKKKSPYSSLIQRYWLGGNFKVNRIFINDISTQNLLDINYSDFLKLNEQLVPSECLFMATSTKGSQSIKLEYYKTKMNIPLTFSFNVSDKYNRIIR